MSKVCYTCSNKHYKNTYDSTIQTFIEERLPRNFNIKHNKNKNKKVIHNLKPNKKIFYFATKKCNNCSKMHKFEDAYHNLENSGVTKTNSNGDATLYLDCPQVYESLNGKVYHRHLHFLYFDERTKNWNTKLYTQPLTCIVNEIFVKRNLNKSLIINALPKKYFEEKSIKGSINIPYNKSLKNVEKSMIEIVGKLNNKKKQLPIIVYCYSKKCDAGEKLINKLNKLGYHNLYDYKNGISEWSGPLNKNI